MDYQASTRSSKVGENVFIKNVTFFLVALLLSLEQAFAQATNPLSGEIVISAVVLATPIVYPDTQPLPPGPINMTNTVDAAIFRGVAYPGSVISVLKNGVVVTSQTAANTDGSFEIRLQNLNPGTYSFGIRAEDSHRLKSKLLLFSVYVSSGITTIVEGIFIPPTITSDKVEVALGENVMLYGNTAPHAEVQVSFNPGKTATTEFIKKIQANATGTWVYFLATKGLSLADYDVKARAVIPTGVSLYSDILSFRVGDTTRLRAKVSELAGFRRKCDLNNDERVNLLDFSIMAFWYKRLGFPAKVDMNSDNAVNLTDLSILAYCWTG